MRSKLHRFLVCVLLALLPLQATLAVTLCQHMTVYAVTAPEPVQGATPEHCDHSQAATTTGMHQKSDGKSHTSEQNQHSCSAGSAACAMCFMAMSTHQISQAVNSQSSSTFVSPRYASFIPEGLQRPPSILV
jgi:hypothetical protein